METKKIWITVIIALLVSGTAVAIVAMGFDHYGKKLSMAADIETESSSNEPILIKNESIEKTRAEHEAELNEWLEIAKKDERVQELIAGKEYEVVSTGQLFSEKGRMAILTLKVEDKYYKITINMNSETVESVEEETSDRTEIWRRRLARVEN
ncbi:MAG: hypothetical protein H8D26_06330 [Methanomicrobia archaeon]|nr:hypothetical protein [Methanomicrobia archaeon]